METRGRPSEPGLSRAPSSDTAVRAFLIVDVRGYTRFTHEHGDEQAGRLAGAFAELARETVLACGGEVIELRGDEALCVFGSARQAVRAAVELQTSFRRQTDDRPSFPLPIGIGLDAGEAVPIEEGYRGGALNTAARLCSLARPGQILATETVVSLARRVEGIRFVERRPVRLKGLEKSVRPIEVVPEVALPPLPEVAPRRPPVARRTMVFAAIACGLLVAAAVALVVSRALGRDFLSHIDANSVGVIDTRAPGIETQLSLASTPGAIAAGGGFVWVSSEKDGTVSRVDPVSHAVQTLAVGESAGGVAYGAGSVWVTKPDERAVAQIDPDSLRVVQTFGVGNVPGPVAAGSGAVWVVNRLDGTVSKIDLGRGAVTETIAVGPSPAGIAVGANAVWVTNEENGAVLRIDPHSGTVVQSVNVGNGPTGIAVADDGVWVANSQDGTVSRIDPASNSISDTVGVGADPSALTADRDGVWAASSGEGTIASIDPDSSRVTNTLAVGSSPTALTFAGGKLWAATTVAPVGHSGGVLRVESAPSGCRCVDPAFFPDDSGGPLLFDGLVAYRRVAGVAGGRLVPNLAARLPTPTEQGRTYAFQLRPGLHYSNGQPVRASDFRASLVRLLTLNRFHPFGGIVGAASCSAQPRKRCDLSDGIEIDDGPGTITIHLIEADPEFLYKLAQPLASVVPAGTPLKPARVRPIPVIGPYRVASFDPDRELRLARNEHFRVWAPEARPDGYPDEIRFRLSDDLETKVRAVEKGTADWVSLLNPSLSSERRRGLLTRYPDRLHRDTVAQTWWWFTNTRVPPFDDLRVRRALNYATDRGALVELTGGFAVATCQVLPPRFPGYQPYCPYTRNANPAGTWTAPDLARARALVTASGTAGMLVEVTAGQPTGVPEEVAGSIVSLLRLLGYRTSLRFFPDPAQYYAYVADSRNRAQIGPTGWQADTLAASNFLRPIFTCASFVPRSPENPNLFEYCNPKLDAKMAQATALQAEDPVRANELWAEVDRKLVDQAVAVSWGSPSEWVLVSGRVGNYRSHPLWGTLLDQLWVK